jgi:hypothetical protein
MQKQLQSFRSYPIGGVKIVICRQTARSVLVQEGVGAKTKYRHAISMRFFSHYWLKSRTNIACSLF